MVHASKTSAKLFMLLTAMVAWVALALQLYIIIDNRPTNGFTIAQAVWRFLLFFTILSNLLVAISLSISLLMPKSTTGIFFTKNSTAGAITLYIFVVGLVYNLVLRSIWHPVGRDKVADELLHVVVPLLYVIYFIFFSMKGWLKWNTLLYWMIYPALYLVYALIRGANENFYVYPFLDLNKLSTCTVVLNCVMVMAAFILFGALIIGHCRSKSKLKR